MKNAIITMIACLLLLAGAGCRRVSHNGDIDGLWKVTAMDVKEPGVTVDMAEGYTIAIQDELMQLRGSGMILTGEINYSDDRLTVDFRSPANISGETLHRFGIWHNPETFTVQVNGKHMTLSSTEAALTCTKY